MPCSPVDNHATSPYSYPSYKRNAKMHKLKKFLFISWDRHILPSKCLTISYTPKGYNSCTVNDGDFKKFTHSVSNYTCILLATVSLKIIIHKV